MAEPWWLCFFTILFKPNLKCSAEM
uniref:Uncharacterized protein n=1 Tax=Anguilla anguilla TaxID=7936 RepID=A0A0E9QJE7_ANGAN